MGGHPRWQESLHNILEMKVPVGVLQGSRHMEEAETSKYHSLHRRDTKLLPIRVRVGAEWEFNTVSP